MKRVVADRPISFNPAQMNDPKSIDLRSMVRQANEEEAAEKAQAELQKKRDNFKADHAEMFNALENETEVDKKFDILFDEFVPNSGVADTQGGEILRAVARIKYRWWNDGDMFMTDYGLETAGPSAAYLLTLETPLVETIDKIGMAMQNCLADYGDYDIKRCEDNYDAMMDDLVAKTIQYLVTNTEEFITPNDTDSRAFDIDAIEQYIPYFESDWDLSQICPAVAYHLEEGNLSERDVKWEVESWDSVKNDYGDRQPEVSVEYGSTLMIYDMSLGTYQELTGRGGLERSLEYYNEEVISEYGDPDDMEDEEEYDEEEYDEEEE